MYQNSKIIDKMLKYCPKNIKAEIISERIAEKYFNRYEKEE